MKTRILSILMILAMIAPDVRAEAKISMDFPDVEIKDMVKSIAEITGKNFILESSTSGKISIMSPTPVTVDEAYQAFLSAISMKGFAVCQEGKVYKIMKKSAAKRECGIPVEEEFSSAQGDEMITRIIPIQYIDANEIQKALKMMISQTTGSSVAYGPTNSLIVTDTASNIRRLVKIIQKLDKQGFEKSVEVIPLQFAQATEVAEKILTIYSQGKSKSSDNSFSYNVERGAEVSNVIPDTRTNSLIVTANRKGLSNVLDLIAELDRQVANEMNQGRIHVRHLKHADAENIAELLTNLLGSGGGSSSKKKKASGSQTNSDMPSLANSTGGSEGAKSPIIAGGGTAGALFQDEIRVAADPGTNSIVVTATPGDFNSLITVINQLDVRRPQVFVEALIMEVGMNKDMNVGVTGHGGAGNSQGTLFGGSQFGGGSLDPTKLAGAQGLLLGGLASKALNLGGLKIPSQGFLLKAVQNNTNVNVLSAPNILTSDNQKAEITVGNKISVPTQTTLNTAGNPITNFQTQEIGLKLYVTPQINDGDEVTLDIEQQIEDLLTKDQDKVAQSGIQTSQRKAKTTVVAQNGQTIVIGGLIQDKETRTKSKVPVLGDIPILGNLFKQTTMENSKVNLMVFITPTILRDPKDMTRVSVQKNDQRRKFNKVNNMSENKGLYNYGFDETLNMAPASTQVVEPTEKPKARKRFNYEQQELTSNSAAQEDEEEKEDSDVRKRGAEEETQTSRRPVRNRQSADSKGSNTSSNPFAEIQPQ